MNSNFRQIKAIEQKNKQRLLEVNPGLDDKSGITFWQEKMNKVSDTLMSDRLYIF